MANWKYTLKVGLDRRAHDDGLITLQELGQRYSKKIKALPCYDKDEARFSGGDDDLVECAHDFEHVTDVEDFDNILETLYNWADTQLDDNWPRAKMCWIEPTANKGSGDKA